MGGSAFSTGNQPLNTPRMTPEVYERVKAQCHAALRNIYLCVASPIDGPGKIDYGDIDILVAWEKSSILGKEQSKYPPFATKQDACRAIQESLGASFLKMENGGDHYAVPWPEDESSTEEQASSVSPSRRYVQVDITICDTLDQMQWKLFKHAHGDLWSILGTIIRPYGLTIDEQALWVRITEIERFNKNKSKVFLTNNPYKVLSFLGLDASNKYWDAPFESLDAMYEYAATCRLFCSFSFTSPELPLPSAQSSASSLSKNVSQTQETSQKPNASDKKRMNSRPAYNKFINEFIPQCRKDERFTEFKSSVESVRREAFGRFKGAKETFEKQRIEFLCERDREEITAKLKNEWVPAVDPNDLNQCQYRGCQIKAFKRIIFEGDNSYEGIVPGEELKDEVGRMIEEKVEQFVKRHMDTIGKIAYSKQQQAYAKHMNQQGLERQQAPLLML
ncbi:uncharacterized protein CTRU02_208515 [Colletotrichum truncatum]|uniref:Uncharacterized protein n=1 Tax=Colletotrichum truncatum TaxID=5467 RepID=A0ACC3YWI2_COLTU|nr:uncharacterized protein CTRU02_10271 [Colletotrichum truncatum]KAF6787475.1 hypothetical protein CTRU02_10271 [Colletotrichum truncatum]